MDRRPAQLALIGAGQRGAEVYGGFALQHPQLVRFVAVAEPDAVRRDRFARDHGVEPARTFADPLELLTTGLPLDGVVVATPDRAHAEPAIRALEHGYAVLLEKPIAPGPEAVDAIVAAAARSRGELTVAHPLRYTGFFLTIAELVAAGRIGDLVQIDHLENISWWHFAHSYVRGNWRRADLASPLILAKACHDLDVIRWLAGGPCISVASSGALRHFRASEAPPGAPHFCLDGCPAADTCPFFAPRLYGAVRDRGGWPVSVVTGESHPTEATLLEALRRGPYGRCVYHADNDVVDHQATLLEFASGVVATLTLSAFTAENTRTIKLMGTQGEIRGHMERGEIEVRRFIDADGTGIPPAERIAVPTGGGHAGGDARMIEAFARRVLESRLGRPAGEPATSLAVSVDSHRMAFAAEQARRDRVVVTLSP